MRIYTGVGSRNITDLEAYTIRAVSNILYNNGWGVRSGGAKGADAAFAERVTSCNYIPWRSFKEHSKATFTEVFNQYTVEGSKAYKIASEVHPAWEKCSGGAKMLHCRNVYQVLGKELNKPSEFLLACSDEDSKGCVKGGTRTAWVIAQQHHIPTLNLRGKELDEVIDWLVVREFL